MHLLLPELELENAEGAWSHCQRLGVVLVVRSLLLGGSRRAKEELLPHAVPDFVRSLSEQQMPDGGRAGSLPQVGS